MPRTAEYDVALTFALSYCVVVLLGIWWAVGEIIGSIRTYIRNRKGGEK